MKRATGLELAALAALSVAQALLFGRLVDNDTDYDEGTYLASLDALEHGQRLGEDVFAPQPPVWYLVLRLISLLGADSVGGFHWGMVGVAVLTCLAAALIARSLAGPIAGVLAGALLTIAPGYTLIAHQVLADVPALCLSLLALLLAWEAQRRERAAAIAAAAGGLLALAVATKPSAALALPVFFLLLLLRSSRRERAFAGALAGGVAVSALLLLAYRDVLGPLWESVVTYHRDARETPAVVDRSDELADFLNPRTPFVWLSVIGLVGSALALRRREEPVWALWLGVTVALAFVLTHHPLHHNHLVVLPVLLAPAAAVGLAAAARRLRFERAALLAIGLLVIAGYAQQHRRLAVAELPESADLIAAAAALERVTDPGDLVVSDQPLVPFLADRRVWGPLVDTANLRFQTGSLTDDEVIRELEAGNVQAVVVGRSFANRPALLVELARRFPEVRRAGTLRVYGR